MLCLFSSVLHDWCEHISLAWASSGEIQEPKLMWGFIWDSKTRSWMHSYFALWKPEVVMAMSPWRQAYLVISYLLSREASHPFPRRTPGGADQRCACKTPYMSFRNVLFGNRTSKWFKSKDLLELLPWCFLSSKQGCYS